MAAHCWGDPDPDASRAARVLAWVAAAAEAGAGGWEGCDVPASPGSRGGGGGGDGGGGDEQARRTFSPTVRRGEGRPARGLL
jgi:hypothetical protein